MKYNNRDTFYDIESLTNVFSEVQWYPALDMAIISYIDDDNILESIPNGRQFVEDMVRKINGYTGGIFWENLTLNGSPDQQHLGLRSYAQRKGLTNRNRMINIEPKHRNSDTATVDRTNYPAEYYPVKDTDPDYDPQLHGRHFGYNSRQYDMTMVALLFRDIPTGYFHENAHPGAYAGVTPTAQQMRELNDQLFEPDNKTNMSQFLANSYDPMTFRMTKNYFTDAWSLHKSWLLTNRYIDVANLNEKQSKVALKRLLGLLGLPIIESDQLSHNTTIETIDQFAALIAYNFSDVLNLQTLFEHKTYSTAYTLKSQLLKEYPETIYSKEPGGTPDSYKAWSDEKTRHLHVRRDRLTADSTSAKFVEFVIAPYNKLKDIPAISFMYPSQTVCDRLSKEFGRTIKPTNVLEDSKQYFEKNVALPGTEAHDEFMQVYNFYKSLEGNNINTSDKYGSDYPTQPYPTLSSEQVRELMTQYNTNLFYFNRDQTKSTCLANFSVGGIHGAEVNMEAYNADMDAYLEQLSALEYAKGLYDGDALAAINGETYITMPNGEERKIREFMKSGSTKKSARWKELTKPEIFKRPKNKAPKLDDRYVYVSVGPANHEDFTSYYPLLLSQLSVFVNPDRGDGVDPYFGIFERRVEMKNKAHDRSLGKDERDAADLVQTLMKLLLNAASGAGDATFDNNIRVNNAVMSMRIIGQLFAWRIGQAQTLYGARVPSTNTDGLYTMDIDPVLNDQILNDVASDMYVSIEPERLDRFVTKDSNNRMEYYEDEIVSAKGGALNSWEGPSPTQSLDHPSVIDYVLAQYLAKHSDPANEPLDRNLARDIFKEHINTIGVSQGNPQEVLRHFQWVTASSTGTSRFVYLEHVNEHTGQSQIEALQHYNRIFLTKSTNNTVSIPRLAKRKTLPQATVQRRIKNNEPAVQHDSNAKQILQINGYDIDNSDILYDQADTEKLKGLPGEQNAMVHNGSIVALSPKDAWALINQLDIDAYMAMFESTFTKSWSNLSIKEHADTSIAEGVVA